MTPEEAKDLFINRTLTFKRVVERLTQWDEKKTLKENTLLCGFPSRQYAHVFSTRYGLKFVSIRLRLNKGSGVSKRARAVDQAIAILRKAGMSFDDIGLILGTSHQHVQQRYGRAMRMADAHQR